MSDSERPRIIETEDDVLWRYLGDELREMGAHKAPPAKAGVVKSCRCGAQYTHAEWLALPDRGVWRGYEPEMEQRRCVCGSHITRPVAKVAS